MSRHAVIESDQLAEGERYRASVDGRDIVVFRVGGKVRAFRNRCPHAGAPVCLGRIVTTTDVSAPGEYVMREQPVLRCPWHGWEFDLETGEHLVATGKRLKVFETEEELGWVYVLT